MTLTTTLAFSPLLKHLRKQAGMTQRDLAADLGYSESLISCLEKAVNAYDRVCGILLTQNCWVRYRIVSGGRMYGNQISLYV